MKIAIVRGDFASPSELQNFKPLSKKHQLVLFTGYRPVNDLSSLSWLKIVKLPSPVDLNIGPIARYLMAITNRLFTDAHVLFGLEEKLSGFDIAHCAETYYSYTQQCIRAKKLGYVKKVVSTVWENIPGNNEGISGRVQYKERSFANIDKFLTVTDGAKQVLTKEGCSKEKIISLKPGIDLEHFYKHQFVEKKGKVKLLFVGRLVPEKGILELIEIFSQLRLKYKNVEFNIVGDGPLKSKVKGPGINYLGKISYQNMPNLYSQNDMLVHYPVGSNTWQEQYGMVLVEAMACALPVVGLDQGSVKEIVGSGGIVVPKNKYITVLESVTKNKILLKNLSIKARKFALKNYNSLNYAKALEKIYQTV